MTLGAWFDYVAGGQWLPWGLAPDWTEGPSAAPTGPIEYAPTATITGALAANLGLIDPQTGDPVGFYRDLGLALKFLQSGGEWRLLKPEQKSAIITALLIGGGLVGVVLTVAMLGE